MTFVANSQIIQVTDTNGTVVFDTSKNMPHIISTWEGQHTWSACQASAYVGYAADMGGFLRIGTVYCLGGEHQWLSATFSYESGGYQKDYDLTAGNHYLQLFVRLTNVGGVASMTGINGSWMMCSGGMLLRAIPGSRYNTSVDANGGIERLETMIGTEVLDVGIHPQWGTFGFSASWQYGSTTVVVLGVADVRERAIWPGDLIVANDYNDVYTVVSISGNTLSINRPFSSTTGTYAFTKYQKNVIKLNRVVNIATMQSRTSQYGTSGILGWVPNEYMSYDWRNPPSLLYTGPVVGTNYTIEYKVLICKY